jgi:hypothetical protein
MAVGLAWITADLLVSSVSADYRPLCPAPTALLAGGLAMVIGTMDPLSSVEQVSDPPARADTVDVGDLEAQN